MSIFLTNFRPVMIRDVFKPVKVEPNQLQKYVESFIRSLEQKSSQTRLTYKRSLKEFCVFHAKHASFLFRVEDIKKYKKHLETKKRMHDVSVRTYMTALRRFLNFLVENQVMEKNPAKRIRCSLTNKNAEFSFLTRSEVQSLIDNVDLSDRYGMRDTAILYVMLYYGISEKELVVMNVGDFKKLKRKYFLILKDESIKGGFEEIPIEKEHAEVIQEYLDQRRILNMDEPLFISYSNRSNNERITVRGVRSIIMNRLRDSKITRIDPKELTPNIVRQTSGVILAKSGKTISEIMKRMKIRWQPTAQRYFDLMAAFDNGIQPRADDDDDDEDDDDE